MNLETLANYIKTLDRIQIGILADLIVQNSQEKANQLCDDLENLLIDIEEM